MNNKWDTLKREYNKWKGLKLRAMGLGVDPDIGYIDVDDSWWAANGGGKLRIRKFRDIVARHEDLLEVIFGNNATMRECAFVLVVDPIDLDTEDLTKSKEGDDGSM